MAIKISPQIILFLIRTAFELGLTDKAMDLCMEFGIKNIKKFGNKFKNIKPKNAKSGDEIKIDSKDKKDLETFNNILDEYYKKEEFLKAKKDNNKNPNEKFIVAAYLKQCLERMKEIKKMIKKFDYSIKKSYIEEILDIENDINKELANIISFGESNINKTNKIINIINEIYKNAYKRKNNISSLSYQIYIPETEEDIDLINNIDIKDFK